MRPVHLLLAAAAVAAAGAATYGIATDGSADGAPAGGPATSLRLRPLDLPLLEPGQPCPVSNAITLPGMAERASKPLVPTEAVLGPGDASRKGLAALREGPAYVALPAVPRLLDLRPEGARSAIADVLWISRPAYQGPILVRGRQLDGRHRLKLSGEDGRRVRAYRLPAGPWTRSREPIRVWGRTAYPRDGWRLAVTTVRIGLPVRRNPCLAFQADGRRFSYRLVFGGIVPSTR